MATAGARKRWFKEMTPRAAELAAERCALCNGDAPLGGGVIHHLEYPFGCYYMDVEAMLRAGMVQWLCLDCHGYIHGHDKPDGPLAKAREQHEQLDAECDSAASRDR